VSGRLLDEGPGLDTPINVGVAPSLEVTMVELLGELLPKCNYVSLQLQLTEETRA